MIVSGGTTVTISSGQSTTGDSIAAGGTEIVLSGGSATSTAIAGTQQVAGTTLYATVQSGGRQEVLGSAGYAGSAIATHVESGGTEIVAAGGYAWLTQIDAGGTLDLPTLSYTGAGSATVALDDILVVTQGGQSYTLQLGGYYGGESLSLAPDSAGGTLLTVECFRQGTRILTESGDIPVEALIQGTMIRTVLPAGSAPVVRAGHRAIDCRDHPDPSRVWPVRIAANAFGPGHPSTELFLSPDHAIYLNNALIPVKYLIDGDTIAQRPIDTIEYHHIALPHHAILFANGLPVESRLPSGAARAPADRWETVACAALIVSGPELAAARALIRRHPGRDGA